METIRLNKILNFKNSNNENETRKEVIVPDHVFFGLIVGIIKGPLIKLPKTYAKESFINDRIISV